MHATHKVLVKLADTSQGAVDMNQDDEDLRDDIRYKAKLVVDEFQDKVFDFYTDIGDVILSRDNLQRVIAEIEQMRQYQLDEMARHLQYVSRVSPDLSALFEHVKAGAASNWAWDLRRFAELAYGDYTFDSCFFDAEWWTSAITDRTINDIKQNPDVWALVYFDMHN